MKIIIPMQGFFQTGGVKILVDIANGFADRGHETIIVMPEKHSKEIYPVRAKINYIPDITKHWIPDADAIITNYYTTFAPAFAANPTKCIRFCQQYEPDWLTGSDRKEAIDSYRESIPTLSISHFLRKKILDETGQESNVLNLGINPNIFNPRPQLRKQRKFKGKIIMYIARVPRAGLEVKGYPDFVDAMRRFHKLNQGRLRYLVYLICNDEPLKLPSFIPHRIFPPQSAPAMARLYQTSDVYISSSHTEGFALPVLEAMACRTPVITTNSGGILDFATHRKTAIIVPPKQPHLLAKAIHWLLKHPKYSHRLAKNAYNSTQHLTLDHFISQFIDWTENIIHERKKEEDT